MISILHQTGPSIFRKRTILIRIMYIYIYIIIYTRTVYIYIYLYTVIYFVFWTCGAKVNQGFQHCFFPSKWGWMGMRSQNLANESVPYCTILAHWFMRLWTLMNTTWAVAAKPLLVDDSRGLYYPLVICYIAIEHCHRNSWFTHFHSMVDLSHQFFVNVYQAGYPTTIAQMLHVWYIYLHLGHLWGKCW